MYSFSLFLVTNIAALMAIGLSLLVFLLIYNVMSLSRRSTLADRLSGCRQILSCSSIGVRVAPFLFELHSAMLVVVGAFILLYHLPSSSISFDMHFIHHILYAAFGCVVRLASVPCSSVLVGYALR